MSKIALSGDASGTGTFTIASPNSNSNYTLTLPTSTGTMALLQTPSFATTIGVGGATPAASGAGITFPATQSASTDANTLDDYEEGTWTPALSRVGSPSSVTYTRQAGTYIKIGRYVYINAEIAITAVASQGTGVATVSGLPFPISASNATWYDVGGEVKYNTLFSGVNIDRVSGGGGQGANAVSFLPANSNTTTETVASYTNAAGTGYLTFTAVYQTTS